MLSSPEGAHVDWNWPISSEKYLKIDWSEKCRCIGVLWELQAPSNGLLDTLDWGPAVSVYSSLSASLSCF